MQYSNTNSSIYNLLKFASAVRINLIQDGGQKGINPL